MALPQDGQSKEVGHSGWRRRLNLCWIWIGVARGRGRGGRLFSSEKSTAEVSGVCWRGGNRWGGLADFVKALEVEGIFCVGEAGLPDCLEALRPLEPLRIFHRPYFSSSN